MHIFSTLLVYPTFYEQSLNINLYVTHYFKMAETIFDDILYLDTIQNSCHICYNLFPKEKLAGLS